jgi:hypothetical protein
MNECTDKLTVIFDNVNNWLKYAEAKNAVLLAFTGAGLTANLTLLATTQNLLNSLRFGLIISTSLLCFCSLLCSLSFLPKTNLEKILWLKANPSARVISQSDEDNLYYFDHLKKYTSNELLEVINNYYFDGSIQLPYTKEHRDLASQITVNSSIASLKFQIFTYSLYFLITSIAIVPLTIFVALVLFREV